MWVRVYLRDRRHVSDLLWNLYLASSTGTTSVSRMYFALGSAAAMTLVLEIAFKRAITIRGPIIELLETLVTM